MAGTRGAKPGNKNALKHGFYQKQYTIQEDIDLEARLANGIDDEIALIRVIIRRLMEESKKEGKTQAKDLFDLLERVSLGAARLPWWLHATRMALRRHESSGCTPGFMPGV
jgi:hypothetical protein